MSRSSRVNLHCYETSKPRAPSGGGLTQAISREVKMRGSRNILTGTVMMSTKGKASDACVDMTAHSAARHTSWMQVNRCIRSVRTCRPETQQQQQHTHEEAFLNPPLSG